MTRARTTSVQPPRRPRHARPARAGFTFLELIVVFGLLATALSSVAGMLMTSNRQRTINRETLVAVDAARTVLETLRDEPFAQIFARYNSDLLDDPDGAGSAPGERFAVAGLRGLAPGQPVGRIVFPSGDAASELREDSADAALGLPRDLNGDSLIDGANHAGDYVLLPVRIEIEWQGTFGPRRTVAATMLASYRR